MRRILCLLGVVSISALSVVGCGSDDDSTPAGTAGAASAGAPGSAGATSSPQCHGDYAVATQAQLGALVDPNGKCAGAGDVKAVCGQDTTVLAETCGGGCFLSAAKDDVAQDTCVTACINTKASPALTSACINCYVTDVACARDHCAVQCGVDPTSTTCATCRLDNNCAQDFFACSGLPGPSSDMNGGAGAAGK